MSMPRSRLRFVASFSLLVAACGGGPSGEPARAPHHRAATDATSPGRPPSARGPATARAGVPPAILEEPLPASVGSVSLEPLATGVRPGGTFLLAARIRIAPGYRIGWKVPGQVGKPTEVAFRGPPGFEVGPALFPAPERFVAPGGLVGYGYAKETAVFAEVKAPARLGSSDVHRFDLEVSFVACKKQCGSERTAAFVELSTAHGDVQAAEVEASLAAHSARLPKAVVATSAQTTWEQDDRHATLVVTVPGATPRDFFPVGKASPAPAKTVIGPSDARFVFDEAPRPGSRPLRGVLVVDVDGLPTALDVEAPLPGPPGEAEAVPAPPAEPPRAKKR